MLTETSRSQRQTICGDPYSLPASLCVYSMSFFGRTTLTRLWSCFTAPLRASGIMPMLSSSESATTTHNARSKRARVEDDSAAASNRKRHKPSVSVETTVSVNAYGPSPLFDAVYLMIRSTLLRVAFTKSWLKQSTPM